MYTLEDIFYPTKPIFDTWTYDTYASYILNHLIFIYGKYTCHLMLLGSHIGPPYVIMFTYFGPSYILMLTYLGPHYIFMLTFICWVSFLIWCSHILGLLLMFRVHTHQENVREIKFFQVQRIVREFCNVSGKMKFCKNVSEFYISVV